MSKSRCRVQKKLHEFEEQTQEAKRRYDRAVRELRNEKQRQRNRRIRENLEQYKNEQPVIDLERQLAGKLVDAKVNHQPVPQDAPAPKRAKVINLMDALRDSLNSGAGAADANDDADESRAPKKAARTTKKSTTGATPPPPDFELIVSQAPTPHSQLLPRISERYQKLLPTAGSTIEISPESLALVADMAKRIGGSTNTPNQQSKPRGAALILDYGPSNTIPTNSLRGIQNHKPISPFSSAGAVDLSADVDFLGLAHAALDASPAVEVHGPVEQAMFLSAMGIKERAEMLVKAVDRGSGGGEDQGGKEEKEREEVRQRIVGSWRRLVDRGPDGMGKTYKALAILPYNAAKEMRRPVGFGGDVR